MRTEMFGMAIAASFFLHGPLPQLNGALMRDEQAAPSWLAIPASADVAEIHYSGGPGDEASRGMVRVSANGDGAEIVGVMMTHLALDGFTFVERGFENVSASQVRRMVTASHPVTSKSAIVALVAGSGGEELRISFNEHAAR
jgi:hypothetical protein